MKGIWTEPTTRSPDPPIPTHEIRKEHDKQARRGYRWVLHVVGEKPSEAMVFDVTRDIEGSEFKR